MNLVVATQFPIQQGYEYHGEQGCCDGSAHQGYGESLEYGVENHYHSADHDCGCGEGYGAESNGAGFDYGLGQGNAAFFGELYEVHQQDGVADDDACQGDHADHGGGGEEGSKKGVSG